MRHSPKAGPPKRATGRDGRRVGVAAAVTCLAFLVDAVFGQTETPAQRRSFGQAVGRFLELVQGDPVEVLASPAVCTGGDMPLQFQAAPSRWFLGPPYCDRLFRSDLDSLHTPLTNSVLRQFFDEPQKYVEALALLRELVALTASQPPSTLQKLELQTVVWQLLVTLEEERAGLTGPSRERVERMMGDAHRLLRATLLHDAEIRQLPDTIASLAEVDYGRREIVQRLIGHDPSMLEILNPRQLHIVNARGSLAARVFFTVAEEDRQRLQEYLLSAADIELRGFPWASGGATAGRRPRYEELEQLSYRFRGLQAVLVLYLNALDHRQEVVPTPVVAGWQEYQVAGLIEPKAAVAKNMARMSFNSIEYLRSSGSNARPRYRLAASDDVVPQGSLFTVNPVFSRSKVTTLRGNCLMCHLHMFQALAGRVPEKVVMTPPLTMRAQEPSSEYATRELRPLLLKWNEEFAR